MKPEPPEHAARIGRRTGIALFWTMAVFVILASTRSVVGQLYGAAADTPLVQTETEVQCARELRQLKRGLLERAGAELHEPSDPGRMRQWLVGWDRRHALLADRCGALEPTRRTLFTLRTRVEALLYERDRELKPLTESIDRALDRFEPRSSPSPNET